MSSASRLNWNPTTDSTPVLHDKRRTSLLHYCTVAKDAACVPVLSPAVPRHKIILHNKMHILVSDHFITRTIMFTSSILHKCHAFSHH